MAITGTSTLGSQPTPPAPLTQADNSGHSDQKTPPAAAEPPKPADGTTVEVDLKPEELKGFTKLSRELREAQARVKELESKVTVPAETQTAAQKLAAAETLVKEGKHLEAARTLGIDLDAAVQQHLASDEPGPVKDPRVDALLAEREAERKKAETDAAEKAKADEEAAKTSAAEARTAATEHVKALMAADATKWPRVAADAGAPEDVLKVAEAVVKKLGRAVSDEEASKIFVDALDEVELDRRVREAIEAERKAAEQPQSREVKPRRVLETREIDTGERRQPSPTIDAQRGSTRTAPPETKQMTAREARELMRQELKQRRPIN